MTDLYQTLGVPRDADRAAIRKAYRKKAMKAHPDQGGAVETFKALKIAHDILTDDERRARYDATGDVGEREPDNRDALAMNMIAACLDALVANMPNPYAYDLVDRMKAQFAQAKNGPKQQRAAKKAEAAKWEKLAQRFERKTAGDNVMSMLVRGKATEASRIADACDAELAKMDRCLEILADYRFTADKVSAPSFFDSIQAHRQFPQPPGMWP